MFLYATRGGSGPDFQGPVQPAELWLGPASHPYMQQIYQINVMIEKQAFLSQQILNLMKLRQ